MIMSCIADLSTDRLFTVVGSQLRFASNRTAENLAGMTEVEDNSLKFYTFH